MVSRNHLSQVDQSYLFLSRDAGKPAGYSAPEYLYSLKEFGKVLFLEKPLAPLLVRQIGKSNAQDAIGPYPFFTCANYANLKQTFADKCKYLLSISVVPDPFSFESIDILNDIFHHVVPFKTHYLVDLRISFSSYMRRHHRRYANRALSTFSVDCPSQPSKYASEWAELYGTLVRRKKIQGISAFSKASLTLQLSVPGCYYFRAIHKGVAHGALICYLDRGVAYAHLVSATTFGQDNCVQYALYWKAIEYFRKTATWFLLGSTPGTSRESNGSGLAFFKSGWATNCYLAYFCGYIPNTDRYTKHCLSVAANNAFFPAYRKTWD